jgi:hypothetical protein
MNARAREYIREKLLLQLNLLLLPYPALPFRSMQRILTP